MDCYLNEIGFFDRAFVSGEAGFVQTVCGSSNSGLGLTKLLCFVRIICCVDWLETAQCEGAY